MAELNDTHPFLVSVWTPGNGKPGSLFDKGYWSEMARCGTRLRAEEVAACLSVQHPQGVQVATLIGDERRGLRWHGYKYLPESARTLAQQEETRRSARPPMNGYEDYHP